MLTILPSNGLLEPLLKLLLVSGIGMLIGLEREFAHREEKTSFAGVRTFTLVAILGFLSAILAESTSVAILVAALVGVSALATVSYVLSAQRGDHGSTTEYSIIIAFILGVLVQRGFELLALSVAVVVTLLLSLKLEFRTLVAKMGREDIRAVLKLLIVSTLLMPLLPDRALDPYGVLNPFEIWGVVVLVLSINFIGFVVMRLWSADRGIHITGLLGGLVSSTALTWMFSRRSKLDPANSRAYGVGVILAISVMFIRVLVLAALINFTVSLKLLLPIMLMLSAVSGIAWVLARKMKPKLPQDSTPLIGNPFNLPEALRFAVLYTGILFLINFAERTFGASGIYLTALLAGIADVDAITISVSRLSISSLGDEIAWRAIVFATLSNNIVKYGLAIAFGSPEFRKTVGWSFGAAVLLGLGSLLVASW